MNAVVVSDATRRLVGNRFAFTDLGEVNVDGFDAPVRAWRLDGELASESRFHALHGGRLGKLIGRDHELGCCVDRWEQACEGERQLVLICGEAGIGKSRLVAEVVQLSGAKQRISYQASPLHTNTALYPVLRQLEIMAGFATTDTPAERFRKLANTINGETDLDRGAMAYLADLMSLSDPTEDPSPRSKPPADVQRDAALDALGNLANAEAGKAPLLMVVEDAHWLDATTIEFVERLIACLEGCKAMLLVTFRPEFVPPWTRHANVGSLALSRLGRRDALAIVNSRLPGANTHPSDRSRHRRQKRRCSPLRRGTDGLGARGWSGRWRGAGSDPCEPARRTDRAARSDGFCPRRSRRSPRRSAGSSRRIRWRPYWDGTRQVFRKISIG